MTKDIFVAEQVPSLNKGEAAILFGMLESFKALGAVRVRLSSTAPSADEARYAGNVTLVTGNVAGEGAVLCRLLQALWLAANHLLFGLLVKCLGDRALRLMRDPMWRAYLGADLIIVGHDAVFVNYPPLNLYVVPLAKMLNKPVVAYGASIGPFRNCFARWLSRLALNRMDLITLREDVSEANLHQMGVSRPPIHVTADLAFLMRAASTQRVRELLDGLQVGRGKPLVGITSTRSMALCYAAAARVDSRAGYEKYVQFKAQLVDHLIEGYDAQVLLLAHSYGPGAELDDRVINRDIYERVENKSAARILDKECTPQEIKGLIGQLTLLVGDRTHSMIAAVGMGVPTIGVCSRTRQTKTKGIIGQMMGQGRWIVDVEALSDETLVAKVDEMWPQLDAVRADLSARLPGVLAAAAQNGELLRPLLSGRQQRSKHAPH